MRKWLRYLDRALIVAGFLMAATALWILYAAIEDVRSIQKDFRENLSGMAAQVDYELLTLLDSLDRFQFGDPGVTQEDVIDRFDVFWSRIETNSSGEIAKHYLTLKGADEALAKAREVLKGLEPEILSLRREDLSGIRDIKKSLRTLALDIHGVTMLAVSKQAADTAELYERRNRSSYLSIFFLIGVLVTGVGAIALLWLERRQLNRLSATLEKRVQERTRALEGTEKRFRDIADAASDWFWELDADLRFSYISDRYEAVAGVSPERLLGRRPDEVYPRSVKRQGELWKTYFAAVRAHEDFREFIHDDFRQDGARRVISNTGKAIFGDDGAFFGYRGTSTDITERQVSEEALRRSEARLAQAQNIAKIGHTIWDEVEERMVYHSETVDHIWGTQPDEIFATFAEFLNTVHRDDRDRVDLVMEQAVKDRTGFEIDYRILRPDDEIRFIREIAEPERDKAGSLVRTISTVQDITEPKRVEEELRESEERYRELFDESPVAIWVEDWSPVKQMLDDLARGGVKDWRGYFNSHRDQLKTAYDLAEILEISRATIKLYHKESREHMEQMSVAAVVIDEELDAFGETLLAFLAGETAFANESKDTAGDGSEIIVGRRVVIPPKYRDDWSRVIYAIEDITERVRAEEQLRQAQKMEVVGQLTGGVAHDFNNLLAVIMGNSELLKDELGPEATTLDPILRAAARGAELTQRLLAFSRQQPLSPQAVDLGSLVSGMSALLSRTLGETVEIETLVAPDLWTASADPGQVENALLNLALNARDAMSGGGKLTVECCNARLDEAYVAENPEARVGDYVVLAVSDAGSGMTAEVQAHAFEPFFTTKEVGQGSGLGLSMVYGFAKQSGGHVSIYSEESRGTTAKLYLPCADDAVRQADARPEEEMPRGTGELVLVIEDDPDVRALTVHLLEGLDYRVIDVPDAATAHASLADGPPVDLVLSDVVLPGGTSGPEFAEQARTRYPELKIIFMSGYPAEAAKRNGFIGSDSVLLNKPFKRQQLAQALRDALE